MKYIYLIAVVSAILVFGGCGGTPAAGGSGSAGASGNAGASQGAGGSGAADVSKYVTLGDYIGLSYTPDTTIDEAVQNKLESFLSSHTTYNEVTDRPVQNGDKVNIDYAGKLDGVAFDGGTDQGFDLVIGSGSFIPGFEDSLIGFNKGQTGDINVTFPANYGNAELSGKAVVFTVTVNSISEPVSAELNDQLVADNTDYKTVEEYKASLRQQAESDATLQRNNAVFQMAVGNATFISLPQDEVDAFAARQRASVDSNAQQAGLSTEDFVKQYYGYPDLATFEADLNSYAQEWVKATLVARAIAAKEGITISDQDFADYVANYAKQSGMDDSTFVSTYGEAFIRDNMLIEKVSAFVGDKAVVK